MSPSQPAGRPLGLAVLLLVCGIVGLISAFALTLDKLAVLTDPGADLDCNFSVLVQCGANLESPQGSVFGFPNPLIGLIGFTAVIVVGAGIVAGARYAGWFWLAFNAGVAAAFAFVLWLISQSVLVLGTLCPWCMAVWAATIPLFLAVTLHNARTGTLPLPHRGRRAAGAAYGWLPFLTLLCYLAVAVFAQVRLDVLGYL